MKYIISGLIGLLSLVLLVTFVLFGTKKKENPMIIPLIKHDDDNVPVFKAIEKVGIEPPKNKTFPLIGICVSANYMDTLKLMLPVNHKHFQKLYIVTEETDTETINFCKQFDNVELIFFKFHTETSKFDKGSGLIKAQEIVYKNHPNSWYLIIDSDILLSNNFINILSSKKLREDAIYGASRYNYKNSSDLLNSNLDHSKYWEWNNILHKTWEKTPPPPSILGCFQLYKKHVFYKPSDDKFFRGADYDYEFGYSNFDVFSSLHDIINIHLGPADGENWYGKKESFKDDCNIKLKEIYFNSNIKSNIEYYDKGNNHINIDNSLNYNKLVDIYHDVWINSNQFKDDIRNFFKNKRNYSVAKIGNCKYNTVKFLSNYFKKIYLFNHSEEKVTLKEPKNIEFINSNIYDNITKINSHVNVVFIDSENFCECCKDKLYNFFQSLVGSQYIVFDNYNINNNLHRFVNKCIKDNILSFQQHIGLNDIPYFFNSLKHTPGDTFKFSHISEGIICKILK